MTALALEKAMKITRASSVEVRPSVELIQWRIMRISSGACHLVGCETLGFSGRVSSAITFADLQTADVRTRSGRRYVLSGPPGFHPAADYVWTRWCALNKVRDFVEITYDCLESCLDGRYAHHR